MLGQPRQPHIIGQGYIGPRPAIAAIGNGPGPAPPPVRLSRTRRVSATTPRLASCGGLFRHFAGLDSPGPSCGPLATTLRARSPRDLAG
jgi:hypothetical protein